MPQVVGEGAAEFPMSLGKVNSLTPKTRPGHILKLLTRLSPSRTANQGKMRVVSRACWGGAERIKVVHLDCAVAVLNETRMLLQVQPRVESSERAVRGPRVARGMTNFGETAGGKVLAFLPQAPLWEGWGARGGDGGPGS